MQTTARFLVALVMLLSLTGCRSEGPPVQRSVVIDDVKLSDILEHPTQFDHVRLRVKGIARIEFEGNSLYADRDALTARKRNQAIGLDVGWPVKDDLKQLNGRDVVVEGTFDASSKGHLGAYVGSMVAISKVSPAR